MDKYIFTSESVSDGHPDKVADQISDALVDAGLELGDRTTRVAIETLVATNHVTLAGEVKNFNVVDANQIVRDTVKKIGYEQEGFHWNTLEIDNPTYALRKEIAKFYFNNNKIQLDEKLLNSFAKYTNKLSVRCIEDMIQEISTFTIKNPNKLNEELIWNVLKKTQVKFVKNKSKKQSDKLSKISQVSQLLFNVLTIGKMGLEAYQYYMQRYALPS